MIVASQAQGVVSRRCCVLSQEIAAKKAALLAGKARREERVKAVAERSASVVRLMELESDAIRSEREAVVSRRAAVAAHEFLIHPPPPV